MRTRSPRTPLFGILQKCAARAASVSALNIPRREFLKAAAASAALASSTITLQSCKLGIRNSRSEQPRIIIVGAGLAGLTTAYYLRKAGLHASIYEASSRCGGRCFTATNLVAPGLTTELGGEFIDSTHEDILLLAREFNLPLNDYRAQPEASYRGAFFFAGELRSQKNIIDEFRPLAQKIAMDTLAIDDGSPASRVDRKRLDGISISEYLDVIGARGWIRSLLEIAYVTEFGLDVSEQSALNLLYMISPEIDSGEFEMYGASDERFKVQGGNDRIARSLASALHDAIEIDHRLERVFQAGASYGLDFSVGASVRSVTADIVILTVPFSILRHISLDIELPPVKQRAIQELGMGTNSKLFLSFRSRPWRDLKLSGDFFADLGSQCGWDNTRLQPGIAGGLTVYSGGMRAVEEGALDIPHCARRHLPDINRIFNDSIKMFSGEAHRFHWPTNPFTRGSYSTYRVGQWTSIAGHEATPVGNIFFAGEHCSKDFQGFLNGAVQSGRMAAHAVISKVLPNFAATEASDILKAT